MVIHKRLVLPLTWVIIGLVLGFSNPAIVGGMMGILLADTTKRGRSK